MEAPTQAAVGAGDHTLAAHESRKPLDALRDERRVLDQIRRVPVVRMRVVLLRFTV